MPARDANRGRGGGRGTGNRPGSAGGRQSNAGASSASSARGGSSAGTRGGQSDAGRSSGRSAGSAQPSRTGAGPSGRSASGRAGGSAASSTRTASTATGAGRGGAAESTRVTGGAARGGNVAVGGSGSGTAHAGGVSSGGARTGRPTSGGPAGAGGVSSGIAGGDLASGGISATTGPSSGTPQAADVESALFGGSSGDEAGRTSERQRDIESAREGADARESATGRTAAARDTASRPAGRGQSGHGLAGWLAGADNPLAMMRRMEQDLERVFRAFGVPRLSSGFAAPRDVEELLTRTPALSQAAQWSPQIEVFERDGNLVVHADLPGVKREDVEVNVENDVLTIRGERRQEHREAEGGYRRTERSYGSFFRQIPLPDGVEPDQVRAAYNDGVLEVTIPAPGDQPSGRRRIEIR
jgi:HSP20 family protein